MMSTTRAYVIRCLLHPKRRPLSSTRIHDDGDDVCRVRTACLCMANESHDFMRLHAVNQSCVRVCDMNIGGGQMVRFHCPLFCCIVFVGAAAAVGNTTQWSDNWSIGNCGDSWRWQWTLCFSHFARTSSGRTSVGNKKILIAFSTQQSADADLFSIKLHNSFRAQDGTKNPLGNSPPDARRVTMSFAIQSTVATNLYSPLYCSLPLVLS